jgi:hypothetical protein
MRSLLSECHKYSRCVKKIYFIFQGVLYLQSVIHIHGAWKKYILFSKAFFTCRVSYIFTVRGKNMYFIFQGVLYLHSVIHIHGAWKKYVFYFPRRSLLAECHTYSRCVEKKYIFIYVFKKYTFYCTIFNLLTITSYNFVGTFSTEFRSNCSRSTEYSVEDPFTPLIKT